MKKKAIHATTFVTIVLLLLLMTLLSGCGRKNDAAEIAEPVSDNASVNTAEPAESPEAEAETGRKLSDEQALSAIKSYCCISNPDLEDIVNAGEYPVYWEISSSDEHEIVVLFRSYTGAQNRYYIDRNTGDTYVTEFVPGVFTEEERTDESFNVRDYSSGY